MKSKIVAYFLWLIGVFGCLGFHRFYLGKTKSGLLWLFTGGLLGVGSLVDLFSLGEQVKQVNSLRVLKKLACGEEITEFKRLLGEDKTSQVETDSYCPYCMGILSRKPKRDIKCPFCQKNISVRLLPLIFENTLLTIEDALVVDHLQEAARFGITTENFAEKRVELQEKFGVEITSVDVFWSLLKQAILETKDLVMLKKIYRRSALFLEDLKQDFYYILQRSAKMQLLEFQKDGFTKQVRIVASSESCPSCRQLDGKIYSIEEALRLMPLPCKECTKKLNKHVNGFCQCNYQAE
jgi:hypothetical protein